MGAALGYALAQSAGRHLRGLHRAGARPGRALRRAHAATGVDAHPPAPGAWMEVLKQAVSVPIFGTVIWLAWVVASAYGATMLAALLSSFLLLAIAGWFLGRWPARGWSASVAALLDPLRGGVERRLQALLRESRSWIRFWQSPFAAANPGRALERFSGSPDRTGVHGPPKPSPAINPRATPFSSTSLQVGVSAARSTNA